MYSGSAKIKKMFSTLAKDFVDERCGESIKGIVETDEKLYRFRPGGVREELLLLRGQAECQWWK